MYTDGYAADETTAGGVFMVATIGDLADHVIIHMCKMRGAGMNSSYEEEKPPYPGFQLGKSKLPHWAHNNML